MTYKISDLGAVATPLAKHVFEADLGDGTASYKYTFPTLLAGYYLETPAQIQGFTSANTAEVEANTLAIRVALRDGDVGNGGDHVFAISRHSIGIQCDYSLTTTGVANDGIAQGLWEAPGICIVNKISISQASGAVSGTRNGACLVRLLRGQQVAAPDRATLVLPSLTSPQSGGLRVGAQAPPKMVFTSMGNAVTLGLPSTSFALDTNPLSELSGGCKSASGSQDILSSPLWDGAVHGHPLVFLPWEGFHIDVTLPAAGTSQTVFYGINIQWEEWLPISRDLI